MNRKTNKHFYPIGMAICIAALAAVLSACVFFGILPTLAAPELSFDDKTQVLSWGAVDNAQGYRVGIALQDDADETLLDTETELTQYDCSELNPGAYRITVQAYGDPDAYKDSAVAVCRLTIVRSQSGGEQNPPPDIVPDPDTVARLDSHVRNLYYAPSAGANLVLHCGAQTPQAVRALDLVDAAYRIDEQAGRVTLSDEYMRKWQTGSVLTVTLVYPDTTQEKYRLHIVQTLPYRLGGAESEQVVWTRNSNRALTLTLHAPQAEIGDAYAWTHSDLASSDLVLAVSIDGKRVPFGKYGLSSSDNTIEIFAAYMQGLSAGVHIAQVATAVGVSELAFYAHDTDVYLPRNVRIDYDNADGEIYVRWDALQPAQSYRVEIGALRHYESDDSAHAQYFDLEHATFRIPSQNLAKGEIVRVIARRDGVNYVGNDDVMDVDYKDETFRSYLNETFEFLGTTYNHVITSEEELKYFVWYGLMHVDGRTPLTQTVYKDAITMQDGYTADDFRVAEFYYAANENIGAQSMMKLITDQVRTYPEAYMTSSRLIEISSTALKGDYAYALAQVASPTPTYYGTSANRESDGQITSSLPVHVQQNIDHTDHCVQSDRGKNYQDFAYLSRERVEVYYSDEVYLALELGLQPVGESGSPAEKVIAAAQNVLRSVIDDTMSDYDKIHSIYDWIAANVLYDHDIANQANGNHSKIEYSRLTQSASFFAEGVFFRNASMTKSAVAVCNGIAKAFTILANMEGIECYKVNGTSGNVGHAWNKVRIGGLWYICDATWANELSASGRQEYLTHDYLMITTQQSSPTNGHKEDANRNWSVVNEAYAADDQYDWQEDWAKRYELLKG